MVGSIGVISVTQAYKNILDKNKIGVTRLSSSENLAEAMFDPMKNEITDEHVAKITVLHAEIFESFKNHVLKYRADKFQESNHSQIFSADVVLGQKAKDLGLIDELGDLETVINEKHEGCKIEHFSKFSKFDKIMENIKNSSQAHLRNQLMQKVMMQMNRQWEEKTSYSI